MRASILIILKVVITVALSSVYHDRIIHINEYNGTDTEGCLTLQWTDESNKVCRSLDFIARRLGKGSQNITIILECPIHIKSRVTFENINLLTINGKSRSTTIECISSFKKSGGLSFVKVHGLLLSTVSITGCYGKVDHYHVSILLLNCSNSTMQELSIQKNGKGSGMVIVNPYGPVSINHSMFMYNRPMNKMRVTGNSSFAGGIHMQFSEQTNATVTIVNCKFMHNKAPDYYTAGVDNRRLLEWNGYSLGGGMGIALLKNSANINIHINNTVFDTNIANWGGGLGIYLEQQTFNNSVRVTNSKFEHNHAMLGGGGVQVRLGALNKAAKNNILFQKVKFEKNYAKYGGGTSITALFVSDVTEPGEILQFINCTWSKNNGPYGPAMDISPYTFQQSNQGYVPIPLFKDSFILSNEVRHRHDRGKNDSYITQGVFVVTRFFIHFQGYVQFKGNQFSALYLTSGRVIFHANSNVFFHSNNAIKGGAIAVYGFSALIINDNSQFKFINNSAAKVGGAISYASSDQREYFVGRTCFLEYGGNETNITKRGISFIFRDNKAPLGGLSVYSESFFACYFAYYDRNTNKGNVTKFFDRIGAFSFDNQHSNVPPLATATREVLFEGVSSMAVIPGDSAPLPLAMLDELHHNMHSEYGVRVEGNEMVHLDNTFTVSNSTQIYGVANQTAKLVLSTPQPLYNIEYRVQVMLLPCPPGFFFDKLAESCKCSADDESHAYPAITKCINFKAYIEQNHWAGYYPSNSVHPDHLYTAYYPSHFNNNVGLPNSSDNLSDFMCGINREGVLCGKCKNGYSAYYHSREVATSCGQNRRCNLGILFYLLSEVVPTIVFFTLVVISGVNFSSGGLNGFVFFCQVVDAFSQDFVFSQLHQENTLFQLLQSGHRFIYGIFNFDYFSTFPFCLWEGATVMNALIFKYVTTTFAFLLIVSIIILMNYSTRRCCKMTPFMRRRSSVTHGISTVLIICYGQCTRVGFFILTKTYLKGKPGVDPVAVTYYGGLPYLESEHLPYAILAIVFTFVLVGLPPLCLIVYPLSLHLLGLCGISEHPLVEKISNLFCVSRFVPLFDSFQSCYKDKMRFFAGFYLLYRVAAYFLYMYSDLVPPVLLAVLILGIHSILQPYKSWKHNVLDALIFLNVAIINSLAIMIKETTKDVIKLKLIQLGFIYMPILSFFPIIALKLGIMFHLKCKMTKDEKQTGPLSSPIEQKVAQKGRSITHTSVEVSKQILIAESNVYEYS